MKGRIIITAASQENINSQIQNKDEIGSGANFDMELTEVSTFDKLTLIAGLADALRFKEKDWAMLLAYRLRLGPFADENRREIHTTIPKIIRKGGTEDE